MPSARPRHTATTVAIFVLALAPHAASLPAWITLWCLTLWAWALAAEALGRRQPPALLRAVLLAGGLAGALAGYFPYALWRLESASAALAVLLGVKALELTSHRSRMAALLMAQFLVVTKVLDTISLEMAAYVLLMILASTMAMARLNAPLGRRAALAEAGRLMLLGLPLAAALFLFFPRTGVDLAWRFGLARSTGFSEDLSPGELTSLINNESPAFRVAFKGPEPPPGERYWRGIVLWNFDGRTWRRGGVSSIRTSPVRAPSTVDYTLTMEPHARSWVFTLDVPVRVPDGMWFYSDLSLAARGRITSRRAFELRSATTRNTGPPLPSDARGLRLPPDTAPRTVALGRGWAERGLTPQQAVDAALDLLRTGGFTYTTAPPTVTGDPTDGLLFGTRSGYCGHYASATTVLLRAAGVPTRIVLGYQGGEANPLGGFFTVRQSDAHAWCEALLPDRGWVRVDPTAAVAPARTTLGAGAVLAEGPQAARESWLQRLFGDTVLNELPLAWDAVRYHLDPWITDLGPETQDGLLSGLGLDGGSRAGRLAARLAVLAGATALAVALMLLYIRLRATRGAASTAERAQRVYLRLCARMARAGLPRAPSQGPLDYAASVAARRPDLADQAARVAAAYAGLRYGTDGPGELARLRRLARGLRP